MTEITPTTGTGSKSVSIKMGQNTTSTEIVETYTVNSGGGVLNEQIKLTQSTGWILDTNGDYSEIITAEYFDEDDTDVVSTRVIVTYSGDTNDIIKGFAKNNTSEHSRWTNSQMFTEYVNNQNGQTTSYFTIAVGIAFDATKYNAEDIIGLDVSASYVDFAVKDYIEFFIGWTEIAKKFNSINFRFDQDGAIYGNKDYCKTSLVNCICTIVDGLPYIPENRSMYLRIVQSNNDFFTSDDLSWIKQDAIGRLKGHHNQKIYIQGLGGEEDIRYWGLPIGETN